MVPPLLPGGEGVCWRAHASVLLLGCTHESLTFRVGDWALKKPSNFHCHGQQAASSKSACTRGSCRTGPQPHGRYPIKQRRPHVWGGKQQPCRQVCRTSSNYTTTLGGLLVHITKTLLTPRAARRPPPMPGHPGAGRGSYALQKNAAQNYILYDY